MSSTSNSLPASSPPADAGWIYKERTVAAPGFSRWLVPPAALAIHLCIGMAYGFSVFWLPLSKAVGVQQAIKCGPEAGFFQQIFVTDCDWSIATLGWMYTLFFVFLGLSAALWGGWLERTGPARAVCCRPCAGAAACWSRPWVCTTTSSG